MQSVFTPPATTTSRERSICRSATASSNRSCQNERSDAAQYDYDVTTRSHTREYISLAVVAGVLVGAVFTVRRFAEPIRAFIDGHAFWGLFLYITLNIVDAVAAPGATLPLIPVAVRVWGRVFAALATTIGWTAGSLIAFVIARRWGQPVVRKITSIERVRAMRRYIPENLFWSIVLVRLVLPMDVISYVLGLFTGIGWPTYVAATALGLTPSAFVLAYFGKLSNAYEILAVSIGAMALIGAWLVARRKQSRSSNRRRKR
jgi:uncharacterized membrane protein YdjX (TVP38/TMEM64 family)